MVVVAVIVGVAIADGSSSVPRPAAPLGLFDAIPIAPADSYSSSAFCTGGADGVSGVAGTTIFLTNTSGSAVKGVMTTRVAPGTGAGGASHGALGVPVRRPVVVPARGTAAVNPGTGLPGGDLATSFAFDGGGVAVEQVVTGAAGWSSAPCASQTSGSWYFAGGSTSGGNGLTLDIFNPSSTEAVVDVSFLTSSGVVVPSKYQGLQIRPGGMTSERIGDFVQAQSEIATVVSAQSGSVVADELQQWPSTTSGGMSLRLGSPAASTSWQFAQTTAVSNGTVTFHLANPGSSPAAATFRFGLAVGTVEPLRVTVAARSVATFVASGSHRLPDQTTYSVLVHATGAIVMSRSVVAPPSSPSPARGGASGSTTTATRWLVVPPGVPNAPGTSGATMDSLAVFNPGRTRVRAVVTALGSSTPVANVSVGAGAVEVLGAAAVGGLRTFEVRADRPVAVEEDSGPSGAPGVASSSGLPFTDG